MKLLLFLIICKRVTNFFYHLFLFSFSCSCKEIYNIRAGMSKHLSFMEQHTSGGSWLPKMAMKHGISCSSRFWALISSGTSHTECGGTIPCNADKTNLLILPEELLYMFICNDERTKYYTNVLGGLNCLL